MGCRSSFYELFGSFECHIFVYKSQSTRLIEIVHEFQDVLYRIINKTLDFNNNHKNSGWKEVTERFIPRLCAAFCSVSLVGGGLVGPPSRLVPNRARASRKKRAYGH